MFISTTTCAYYTAKYILCEAGECSLKLINDNAFTGAGFQYTSSTCITTTPDLMISTTLNISTSSMPAVYNGFTYGELIISIFLFLIFVSISYGFIFNWLRGIKIKQ